MKFQELLDKYADKLRVAFLSAIYEIRSRAHIGQISKAMERGNLELAIDAVYMDRGAFDVFEDELHEAFGTGGRGLVDELGQLRDSEGARFIFRFSGRNPRAERWLKEHSSGLVTGIVDEQRRLLRETLVSGLEDGRAPRSVGLDIVGRINRQSGRREGGLLGLSKPQVEAVERATRELMSGDYTDYLRRELRDKRFDRTVVKAAKEGRPLTAEQARKMVGRYADKLLEMRGRTIARTEAHAALNSARYEALEQLAETGKINAQNIKRVWDATGDLRVRNSHAIADGQTVGLREDFVMSDGATLRYPGDPRGGPQHTINCRCYQRVEIDFLAGIK